MAITMNPTISPITRMMTGSSSDMSAVMRVSTVRSKESEILSSIFSSSPLFSPTTTIWITTGGNRPLRRSGSAMGSPSRTFSRARCTALASTVFPITLFTISSAVSAGTPLSSSVPSVRVKRDTAIILISPPKIGMRKSQPSSASLPAGVVKRRLR